MNKTSWMIGLILCGVFTLGFFSGTLVAHWQVARFMQREFHMQPPDMKNEKQWAAERHAKMKAGILQKLEKELSLRPDQSAQVKAILDQHAQAMMAAEEEFGQAMRNHMQQTNAQIMPLLDAAQKVKFTKFTQRFRPPDKPDK